MKEEVEKGTVGPSFDEFLKEEGIYEEVNAIVVKRLIASDLARAMREQGISKVEMAKRLETSRSQLDQLLDPDKEGVTMPTLIRAAKAVGRNLHVELS